MQTVFNPARRPRQPRRWFKAGVLTCAMMSAGLVSFGAKAQLVEVEDPAGVGFPFNDQSAVITGGGSPIFPATILVSVSNPTNDYTGITFITSGTLLTYVPNALGYSQMVILQARNTNPFFGSTLNTDISSGTYPLLPPTLATNGCAEAVNNLYGYDATDVVDTTGSCLDHAGDSVDNPDGNVLTLYATDDTSMCPTLGGCFNPISSYFPGTIQGPGAVHIVNGNRPTSGTRLTTPLVPDLTKVGFVELTGTNTYTGGTTIESGYLVLGNGTTTGTIVGDVTDNGTLDFYPGASGTTFGGVISGTGAVTQVANTTILTAAETYTGITAINGGTLQLGDGVSAATNGSLMNTSTVSDGALLALDPADGSTQTVAGNIVDRTTTATVSGDVVVTYTSGAVSQIGPGTTVLSGSGATYSGPTDVTAGTLAAGAANVFSAASDFTVADATLALQDFSQTVGSLDNTTGTVDFGTAAASATPGVILTVARTTAPKTVTNGNPIPTTTYPTTSGDYTGGGTLLMSGVLDGSANDVLHVRGLTTGATVIDYTGKLPGAATTGDGILVVQVDAANGGSPTGTFTLKDGPTKTVGIYTYSLVQGKLAGDENNWYLQVVAPQLLTTGTAPIPTLSETALALLAALLGVSAMALNRRER